jgi:pimeloyl-ACP methyl ester carboxylesterase
MNDWICDTSTWDAARPYLDTATFTWLFADLRGYGRSRALAGTFTIEEAAADVIALADAVRRSWLGPRLGDRLSEGWLRLKLERWRATSDPEAVAGYAPMFARRGLPDPRGAIACPLLAVTGERDIPPMRQEAVAKLLAPLSARLVTTPLADSAHYPMQEAPPLLATVVERFLAR